MSYKSFAITISTILTLAIAAWCANNNLPVPANLKADGLPQLPESLLQDLAPYSEFRTATLLDWHPTRREILIATRFGDVPQVHRVSQPGGARTQLTFFPERILGARYRPTSDDVFLFSKDVGGGEWFQLYTYDTRTGRSTLLTDGKSRNTGPLWSKTGKLVAYSSTRRNGKDNDIYVVDPDDPKTTRMVSQGDGGGWYVEEWSPDDRTLIVGNHKSAYEAALYKVDVTSGTRTPLTPETSGVAYEDPQYAPDGKGIYLLSNQDSDFERLAYLDLATRKVTFIRPDLHWDVSTIALSQDGKRLAYVVNEAGSGVLNVLDTGTRRQIALPHLPYGNLAGIRWHHNGRDLGFTLTSARSPSDAYSIDVDSSKLERWTTSETGGLDASQFVEPELISWKSFDGLKITGFYYAPPKRFTGPRPVIVNIHGGPESQYEPGYMGTYNYLINELGVAMILPNVRGSSGYGKTYLNLDNGVKREDSVKDIGALLDWIAMRPDLDPKRAMVTGGSYGGYMTLASMTHYNDRFRCALDIVGISNWITFLEYTESYRRDLRRVEYGDERDPKMRDFLSTISPVSHVRSITKPMFIVAGKNDPRVPYTEGEQMAQAIRGNGVPVWYLLADDEGHGYAKKKNRDYLFASTVLFIKQYLLQ